jgi:Uma2 family endonuclease
MVAELDKSILPRTMEEFLNWEPPIDGYKYEWNDGEIIKFVKMKQKHLRLLAVLYKYFDKTKAKLNGGLLIPEQDVNLTTIQMRRPDLAYFNNDQIEKYDSDEEQIPEFVIEVISPTDNALQIEIKLKEYFKTGVRVVWHVMPEEKTVYVYTSRKNVKICTDDDICSASPVMDDFEISVNELFS